MSESDTRLSCAKWDLINDPKNRIVPGYSEAIVDRENGLLFVSVGGGLSESGEDNGGKASALFRETFRFSDDWKGWLTVRVNLSVNYVFDGYGISQLLARLRTYSNQKPAEDARAGFRLRQNKLEHARLYRDEEIGEIDIPVEGHYAAHETVIVSTTSFVHHSRPELDVRVDLVAHSLPRLAFLETVSTASIESSAKVELVIPNNEVVVSSAFMFNDLPGINKYRIQ